MTHTLPSAPLIRARVARAADDVVPQWPLESFIAVNPLAAAEGGRFEDAAQSAPGVALTRAVHDYVDDFRAGRISEASLRSALLERGPELGSVASGSIGSWGMSALELIVAELTRLPAAVDADQHGASAPARLDELMAHWLAAYLDPEPLWPMPGRELGFFRAWRLIVRHDPAVPRSARRALARIPESPDAVLAESLHRLAIDDDNAEVALRAELAQLPGWVAHIKWRADHVGDIDLTSYLAVRFAVRSALGMTEAPIVVPAVGVVGDDPFARAAALATLLERDDDLAAVARILMLHPVDQHAFTWQRAAELEYSSSLIAQLGSGDGEPMQRPISQVVLCIDPRSEGLRRQLERSPGIATLGFAGFFAVPMRYTSADARGSVDSLPALLSPRHSVTEVSVDAREGELRASRMRLRDAVAGGIHRGESVSAAGFALAETSGWFMGLASLARTFAPAATARFAGSVGRVPEAPALLTVDRAFSLEERTLIAEAAVRMMGITSFAPLVVFGGHASSTTNNLFQSALDCGACGGNPGSPNARAAAAIFNDPAVRAGLVEHGILIPDDTWFVAAEHNTVTDELTVLDRHLVPQVHLDALADFDLRSSAASDRLVRERAAALPGATARTRLSRVRERADDWAEVYPEWGLARNAAMIIGPRSLTRGVDLGRRVFLHSYDAACDPNSEGLESILTAPLVVAQWINHQYYFSALNPDTLGAGTKTLHNAIGGIGVLQGQSGDLMRGLPWQSVGFGEMLVHEPLRLSVIVEAPLERVGAIIARNQVLRSLFENNWISLTARDDQASEWHRYGPYGWEPVIVRETAHTMTGDHI